MVQDRVRLGPATARASPMRWRRRCGAAAGPCASIASTTPGVKQAGAAWPGTRYRGSEASRRARTGSTVESIEYSSALACPKCGEHYEEPVPNLFSFNSPVGACESCRGFGRTMGIDYDLVIPDPALSLAEGAVKVWQSKSYRPASATCCATRASAGCRWTGPGGASRPGTAAG